MHIYHRLTNRGEDDPNHSTVLNHYFACLTLLLNPLAFPLLQVGECNLYEAASSYSLTFPRTFQVVLLRSV